MGPYITGPVLLFSQLMFSISILNFDIELSCKIRRPQPQNCICSQSQLLWLPTCSFNIKYRTYKTFKMMQRKIKQKNLEICQHLTSFCKFLISSWLKPTYRRIDTTRHTRTHTNKKLFGNKSKMGKFSTKNGSDQQFCELSLFRFSIFMTKSKQQN